jgi:hypothetical protein
MELTTLTKVRRLALAAVCGNVVFFALLAAVLPQVLLPIAALVLPLLTAAFVEAQLQRAPRARELQATRSVAHVQRALPQAA